MVIYRIIEGSFLYRFYFMSLKIINCFLLQRIVHRTKNLQTKAVVHPTPKVNQSIIHPTHKEQVVQLSSNDPTTSKAIKKRVSYSKESTNILNNWFIENQSMPYPTKVERKQLSDITHLTIQQVTYWMSNKRKKIKNQKKT